MRRLAFLCTFLGAASLASAAQAGPYYDIGDTPGVDARQSRQQLRIDNGVASGALTPAEEARLQSGQARVDRMESRFKADGVVTRWERARLHGVQDRQSRKIYRKKHNLRWR